MEYAEYKYNKYKSKLHKLSGGMSGGVLTDDENDRVAHEISTNTFNVSGATVAMREDPTYMLAAVTQDARSLEFASDLLKADPGIVLAAVTQKGYALDYASDSLKDNYAIVLAAATRAGGSLQYASDLLKNNYGIVLAAVTQEGISLQYASNLLKSNREIVMAAVTEDENALQHSSMQYDPKILRHLWRIYISPKTPQAHYIFDEDDTNLNN